MYLSAERLALANQTILETFAQTSIAWQAIPRWDTGDPAQTQVRSDDVSNYLVPPPPPPAGEDPATPNPGPLGGNALPATPLSQQLYLTLAQAIAPRPDALLAAIIARTSLLARKVDDDIVLKLFNAANPKAKDVATNQGVDALLSSLINARVRVEKYGYRAPSCLFTSTRGLQRLSQFPSGSGYSALQGLLDAANINSLYRFEKPPLAGTAGNEDSQYRMLLLGRRQLIRHGGAPSASAGEEPVDLAVIVPPSLEVVGETSTGNVELAIRVSLVPRIKDNFGVVGVVI
jgi:hypothetical protein